MAEPTCDVSMDDGSVSVGDTTLIVASSVAAVAVLGLLCFGVWLFKGKKEEEKFVEEAPSAGGIQVPPTNPGTQAAPPVPTAQAGTA